MVPASTVRALKNVPAMPFAAARAGERRQVRFHGQAAAAACGGEGQTPALAAVPASLREIQAKRKMAAAPGRGVPRAAGTAVAALAAVVEAVQGAAVGGARGAGDAVACVFRKVHFESPELAMGLLGLVATCLGSAVEREMNRIRNLETEKSAEVEPDGDAEVAVELPEVVDNESELWARIGIMHGILQGESEPPVDIIQEEDEDIDNSGTEQRKAVYETIIATGDASSLILSNYAQLLYQYDKDLDRAEVYFKKAVAAEPADGEAMRRYAIFLWKARSDHTGAEDMFTAAIDAEPESNHHRSSYAWFLWMTGAVETCIVDGNTGNANGN